MYRIERADLDDPRVIAMLQAPMSRARAATAPGSAHALDIAGLRSPDVRVWTVWDGEGPVGVRALKRLTRDHGEAHHQCRARSGLRPPQPAVALYRSPGLMECQPFGDYVLDPNSIFMTLDLSIRPQLEAS
jgi:putative acetyltransferase